MNSRFESPECPSPAAASDGESDAAAEQPRSRLISRVLTSALRLWLRSQVEQVEALHIEIQAGDRQILTGYLPEVSIAAENAVYKGLHLSRVRLRGTNIRVNLGQVLRGKPLRLLAIVPVEGEVLLRQADLNASLQAPLLANAVREFLVDLLRSGGTDLVDAADASLNLQHLQVLLGQPLTLSADLVSVSGRITPFVIRTGLRAIDGHKLQLAAPQWLPHAQAKRGLPLADLDGFAIDLGSDVDVHQLQIEDGQITCQGRINVIP
jgi:hypothetical protein